MSLYSVNHQNRNFSYTNTKPVSNTLLVVHSENIRSSLLIENINYYVLSNNISQVMVLFGSFIRMKLQRKTFYGCRHRTLNDFF